MINGSNLIVYYVLEPKAPSKQDRPDCEEGSPAPKGATPKPTKASPPAIAPKPKRPYKGAASPPAKPEPAEQRERRSRWRSAFDTLMRPLLQIPRLGRNVDQDEGELKVLLESGSDPTAY